MCQLGYAFPRQYNTRYMLLSTNSPIFHLIGQVPVDPDYLKVSFTDESLPVAYLIPTPSGPGICSVALVHLLVSAHNGFIDMCRGLVSKQQQMKGKKE